MGRESKYTRHFILTFISLFFAINSGFAEGPVEFGDAELKEWVEIELRKDNPTAEDMQELWMIGYHETIALTVSTTSLKGLEYAGNMKYLHLKSSPIQDFSVLLKLTKLENLSLDECEISDLSPVISAIESHSSLKQLSLLDNRMSDISPLLKLQSKKLQWIDLKGNPLSEEAYKTVIPQLQKNNPGIQIYVSFRMNQLIWPGIFLAVLVIAGVPVVVRCWRHKGWGAEVFIGLLSAGVGCFLGLGSQFLYGSERIFVKDGNENPMWVGAITGGVFGLLAGVWFAQYLRGLSMKGYSQGRLVGRGALVGIVPGILCSTAVHAVLMTAYRSTDFIPMLVGAGFGIGAGFTAGLVLAGCFAVGCKMSWIKVEEKV